MTGLIGRKLGMTRVFDAEGAAVPVTVIEAGPCPVVQVAGNRIELGFGARKLKRTARALLGHVKRAGLEVAPRVLQSLDRKSTRLNSSHQIISYAVFCLKKKKKKEIRTRQN